MSSSADHLRHRVVVRFLTGATGPTGGPEGSDVIGRLLGVDPLRVERRDGSIVEIDPDTVVALKPVPDRPARRRRAVSIGADELERITSLGWPALESERLGDWEMRAARGFTGRANSVLVGGDPGIAFDDAVLRIEDFYRERGLTPLVQVVADSPDERAFLAADWMPKRGYRGGAVVQVADLGDHSPDPEAAVDDQVTDDWLARYERIDEDRETALAVLSGPETVGFVRLGSPALAIGRVVVTGQWAGIAAVETHPDHRRQGLARRVVETAMAWAADHGAVSMYLQTMPDNAPALALYAPFGFVTHHEYRYLEPGSGSE